VGKQTAAYPPHGARHLALPENSCMDLPTDFDCSVHIQLRFGGNQIEKKAGKKKEGTRNSREKN
jgi:hypothetical protein